jgi:membrane protein required for colicin V production
MSGIDLAILGIVGFCILLGLYWGIIRQVLAITGFFAGLALAAAYERDVAALFSSFISEETFARTVAFLLIILVVSGLASLAATLIRTFFGLLFLGWLDHLAGGMLGLVQGVLVITAMLIVFTVFPNQLWTPYLQQSQIASPIVSSIGPMLVGMLPESFRLGT